MATKCDMEARGGCHIICDFCAHLKPYPDEQMAMVAREAFEHDEIGYVEYVTMEFPNLGKGYCRRWKREVDLDDGCDRFHCRRAGAFPRLKAFFIRIFS